MKDLVILSPDGAYKVLLPALLKRNQALKIRQISVEVISDPYHDSSGQIVELLRPFLKSHARALVVRDVEGSGQEAYGATVIEGELRKSLLLNGWNGDNSDALALEPEIESWLRLDSAHLENLIKQRARKNQNLVANWKSEVARAATRHGGWISPGKPLRPKEVYHESLRYYGISPSNALLGVLAEKETLVGCQVQSFNRFLDTMRKWFPPV
jgi:hypothetical protein